MRKLIKLAVVGTLVIGAGIAGWILREKEVVTKDNIKELPEKGMELAKKAFEEGKKGVSRLAEKARDAEAEIEEDDDIEQL